MFCSIKKMFKLKKKIMNSGIHALNLNLYHCLGTAVSTLLYGIRFCWCFFLYYDCNTIIYNFYLGVHVTMKENVMTPRYRL